MKKEAEAATTIINIKEFPADLHRKIKVQAAVMGIPMREFFIRAAIEYLKKQK
jgi:hypothetical protein